MKRQTIFKIVRSHYDKDERNFSKASRELARDLNDMGEKELAREITKIIRKNSKVVLSNNEYIENYVLSKELKKTLVIIENSINRNLIQKIYLHGSPGTGKTVFSEIIARKINVPIRKISLAQIIDSRLGESVKLLDRVFNEDERMIIFIDEIDSIASHRNTRNDVFEISRLLNHLLQLLDSLSKNKIVIVATNLLKQIDSAFIRRFDISVNFNSYKKEDIENIFSEYQYKYELYKFNEYYKKLKKLVTSTHKLWTPSYIKRIIQISSIWLNNGEKPKQQIIEILRLLNFGCTREEIKSTLGKYDISKSMINYFLGAKNEKYY